MNVLWLFEPGYFHRYIASQQFEQREIAGKLCWAISPFLSYDQERNILYTHRERPTIGDGHDR